MEQKKYDNPLVSVLIPTHERPYFCSLALASVINQSYNNIEIVISDNSMGNETEMIVADFMSKYDNIKYSHTPGLDACGNWQKCWDNMSPESVYVNFLMDDDIFARDKIKVMVDFFEANPRATLVTSYRKLIDKDGNLLPDCFFNKPLFENNTLIPGEAGGTKLLSECFNWIGELTTVLFRKEYCDGFFFGWTGNEKYLIADYLLWLRLMEKGDVIYIVQPLSFYRQHEGNGYKNFLTNIEGDISMALAIQNAWNNKKFLVNEAQIRQALLSWIFMSAGILKDCYDNDYQGKGFDDLLVVYREITQKYACKNIKKLEFDI